MFKFKFCVIALALVASSIASGQEKNDFKSDLFGKEALAPVGDVAPAQAPHKITISNGSTSDTAASSSAATSGSIVGSAAESGGRSEFQKFIAENTGQSLSVFGSEFFSNPPSTFAPITNTPVPADYPLGPGDQLLIRGWGTIDIDYRATIDRNGTISLPTIGTIVLAGVPAGEAENVLKSAVAKLYKGVTLNVTFGQLRAITVYLVGQALRPGTYTVSSLSTLVTALFATGGPNRNGSMRHVQVKRAGKVAVELDLYAFIAKGDKSADIKLLDGDTIYIPPAGGFVALVGKVNSPAIYELKSGSETVASLLDFAGGLPVVADYRRAYLERIDPAQSHPRSVEEFSLTGEGLQRKLKNGDVLNVTSITPDFSNAVVLRGNVDQPVRAPFRSGMHISDLIPSREYLITRASVKRQNNVVETGNNERKTNEREETIAGRIGDILDEINWDYAVVERVNRSDLTVSLIPFNLGKVFTNPSGAENIQLQPGDTVTIFSQSDVAVPMEKRRVMVRVEGEVKVPGVYQMTAGDTLQVLLAKAGGPTSNAYLFGTAFYRESVRREQHVNLLRAADKLEAHLRSEQAKGMANLRGFSNSDSAILETQRQAELDAAKETLARFRRMQPTGRIAFGLDSSERSFARIPQLKLENGDRLVIPSRPAAVNVFGAVNVEASPLWRPNSRVSDYLKVAGVTSSADVDNVFVMRVDGTVVSQESKGWFFGGIGGVEVMPGDNIVIPEKTERETSWTKFVQGTREWAQIFANFGLGAAAIKTLRN
jgi:protein involved in polysaccharide export with SLBB domain